MPPIESFPTGRLLALLMQKNFPQRAWIHDLAERAGESRDKVEWHLQEDMAPPRSICEAATALLDGSGADVR